MSGNGYGSRDSVQAPLTLITAFLALCKVQHLWQVGPRLRRGRWRSGLQDGQMVDDETGIGVAVDQRHARIHVAPAQYVDWKVVLYGRTQDTVALPPHNSRRSDT